MLCDQHTSGLNAAVLDGERALPSMCLPVFEMSSRISTPVNHRLSIGHQSLAALRYASTPGISGNTISFTHSPDEAECLDMLANTWRRYPVSSSQATTKRFTLFTAPSLSTSAVPTWNDHHILFSSLNPNVTSCHVVSTPRMFGTPTICFNCSSDKLVFRDLLTSRLVAFLSFVQFTIHQEVPMVGCTIPEHLFQFSHAYGTLSHSLVLRGTYPLLAHPAMSLDGWMDSSHVRWLCSCCTDVASIVDIYNELGLPTSSECECSGLAIKQAPNPSR
jgi:hypothetical protein